MISSWYSALSLSNWLAQVTNDNGFAQEQLDLSHFIEHSAAQRNSSQGTLQAKPPFAVVVKSPCLAVKYPRDATHIRRFQIKFSRNTDYFTALAFLSEANCSFTEGSTAIATQPLRRLPTSSSLASFQTTTIASKDASTTAPSENELTTSLFPISGYTPSGITTSNPPSSAYGLSSHNALHPEAQDQLMSIQQPNQQVTITGSDHKAPQRVNNRTATAPAYHGQKLDEMLPPKRALPFLKPAQKVPRREASTASVLSPPAQLEGQPNDPSKNMQPLPFKSNILSRQNSQLADSQSYSPAPTQAYLDPPPSSHGHIPQLSEYSRVGPVEETQPVSHIEMNTFAERSPEDERRSGEIHTAQERTMQPTAISAEQLSTYLSTPTPERVKLLENWMCELIEDDRFMELCQDVEATWKRFAFGRKV